MKEVQQLTGRMAALSRFVSAGGEKGHPYFQCLKRNSRFAWTDECEATFIKLKEYMATLMEEAQAEAHMQAHQRVDLGQP